LEQAGQGVKDHVENGGAESTMQEKDENSLFILGDTLPVVPPKLVKRILKGKFVDMTELLKDNMDAERRNLASTEGANSTSMRREVPNLLSWVYCYSLFAAIVCSRYPQKSQEMWAGDVDRRGQKMWGKWMASI